MAMLNFHPGGAPDAHDKRDRRFTPRLKSLPARVDLSSLCGPVYNQYRTQSCSANALAAALVLLGNQQPDALVLPSRLFIYYNARALTGTQATDSGSTIRDAIKAYARDGACVERQWPFLKSKITARPSRACYGDAHVRPISYHRIAQKLDHLRAALAQGHAFIFGIAAYGQPFTEAATSGKLRLPRKSDTLFGGHALIATGYDIAKKTFTARNSLGRAYADDGFFAIPDAYFTNPQLTYDFWLLGGNSG